MHASSPPSEVEFTVEAEFAHDALAVVGQLISRGRGPGDGSAAAPTQCGDGGKRRCHSSGSEDCRCGSCVCLRTSGWNEGRSDRAPRQPRGSRLRPVVQRQIDLFSVEGACACEQGEANFPTPDNFTPYGMSRTDSYPSPPEERTLHPYSWRPPGGENVGSGQGRHGRWCSDVGCSAGNGSGGGSTDAAVVLACLIAGYVGGHCCHPAGTSRRWPCPILGGLGGPVASVRKAASWAASTAKGPVLDIAAACENFPVSTTVERQYHYCALPDLPIARRPSARVAAAATVTAGIAVAGTGHTQRSAPRWPPADAPQRRSPRKVPMEHRRRGGRTPLARCSHTWSGRKICWKATTSTAAVGAVEMVSSLPLLKELGRGVGRCVIRKDRTQTGEAGVGDE